MSQEAVETSSLKVMELFRKTFALYEIVAAAGEAMSIGLNAMLPTLVELIADFVEAEVCTIFLHDTDTNELFSRISTRKGGEGAPGKPNDEGQSSSSSIQEIRFPSSKGIAGECFTTARCIHIPDAYEDPRFNRKVDRKTGFKTQNILCVPIKRRADARIMEVIQCLNKKGGAPKTSIGWRT